MLLKILQYNTLVENLPLPFENFTQYSGYPVTWHLGDRSYPIQIQVAKTVLPQPRLLVGTWDYTDKLPALGLTERNVDSAVALMDKMLINVPWGGGSIYFPQPSDFNSAGEFIGDLRSEIFEQWLKDRPDKPVYCVFINTEMTERNHIAGHSYGSGEFTVCAANWIRAWDRKLESLGLQPGQVQWLLVDEVWDDKKAEIQTAWSRAFAAVDPVVLRNWNNPVIDVKESKYDAMIGLIDSLCAPRDKQYIEEDRQFYLREQAKGKQLWTYACNGPSRLFDPFSYYKMHGLGAWKDNIVGIGIWAFGDVGKAAAFNEYLLHWAIFSPVCIDTDEVFSTLALEALREGIEDHEIFSLLEERLPEYPIERRQAAENLLRDLKEYIVANTQIHIKWYDAAAALNRERADWFRCEAIRLLEQE